MRKGEDRNAANCVLALRLLPPVPSNTRSAVKDTTIPVGGGPDGRSPYPPFAGLGRRVDEIERGSVRDVHIRVREMILRSYELQSGEEPDEQDVLEQPINERLGDVVCPTLVIVGDEDIADMQGIAAHLASSIDGARLETVSGASHLPSLERPDEVNAILVPFLLGGG